ncbi:hypothetical protein [Nocardia sp. NPDC020380]|uniref:hypothetical protein n=1 Tax=Nocardia sp. NPDC020380 TaxID=3364309 RepID=UPI0037A07A88
MTRQDATAGVTTPVGAHAGTGDRSRRRAETVAGVVLATLSLLVVLGWLTAPGESAATAGTQTLAPAPPQGDGTLTYAAVAVPGGQPGTATALILGFMIVGAALIGLFFYSPRPLPAATPTLPEMRRRPHPSGVAVATKFFLPAVRQAYSSSAPGAVFETVIRNSILDLVFFNRSTIKSIA